MSQVESASAVMEMEKLKMDGGSGGRSGSFGKRRAPKLEDLVESMSRAYNEKIGHALGQHECNFVLSDPRLPDHPIVFASEGFLRMSGYEREEVLGRNCRFLQGPDTDRGTVVEIRDAIREERACQVRILNYTKQGAPFWNLFHMAPIFASDGRVMHYVGVQTPIAPELASEAVAVALPNEVTVEDNTSEGDPSEGAGQTPVNLRLSGGDAQVDDEDDGEPATVNEDLKQKAALAVQRVTGELTQSSRVKGAVLQKRRIGLSESAAKGVVSSSLMLSLTRIQQSLVLADPSLPDTPIVHASDVFCELTGYSREEVVGRNCRFLQGPGTDPEAVREIREAIEGEKPCTVRILNYRKDNTPFWNHLHVAPVRSATGKVAYYVGVQLDVSDADIPMRGDTTNAHAKQLSAVGVVRVAVRSLQGSGLRRTLTPPRPN
uniref:Putative LOV domain-containing protein n=1 Tax=Scouleria aquatica TaxID=67421 RepID=A0A126WV96_9BRYO|nr:putative LOV domain-containing protein [Scouleria aquatica]